MVFSSHLFLYTFLPAALLIYYVLPRRARHLALTGLSYVFYGWSNPAFMGLMLLSTLIDYVCGLAIYRRGTARPERDRAQRLWLAGSLVSNLSLLGFFKYFDFAVESWNAVAQFFGVPQLAVAATLRVVLPLGISFYTFQSMSYTLDVYRGRTAAISSFVDFACFVSMFPQLVAGPIVRFADIADQLATRRHTLEKFARGVVCFALGLGKKVLVANPCGWVADQVFDAAERTPLDAWWGLLAYSFQIYFDFSGYSDMAIGLGLMLGFVFLQNFNSPYRAESLTDFWRRWHMSLSSFLRDYLYFPLGGNRRGERRTYVNLMAVMLLGGLWHGASWNFVAWGGLHGLGLSLERWLGKRSVYAALPRPLRVGATFAVVTIAWVFFRSPDLASAGRYLATMAGALESAPRAALLAPQIFTPYSIAVMALAAATVWGGTTTWRFAQVPAPGRAALASALFLLALLALAGQGYNPFIYFIF
jgi:alginate O-acetyltransferase complex protein AlgI